MDAVTDTTAPEPGPSGDESPASARRPRREKGARESLLQVTIVMEVLAVIFGALAINGLEVLPSAAVFGGAAAFIVLLIIAARVARYTWGVWFGSVLQLALLATGFIEVLAAVTAAVFVGFWIYGVVKGGQLDAAKRAATEGAS
nr:DUF4233 domain-containing protein [Microcella frigidaquae]